MFTGLVEAIGQLSLIETKKGDSRLVIRPQKIYLAHIQLGDSISINGVCLTVVDIDADSLSFDVSLETLKVSALNQLASGSFVNLEQALKANDRLGGHIVTGHIDGVAELLSISKEARSIKLAYQAPKDLMRYIAKKGSVTLDGVSLTVNAVSKTGFDVNIIPHTYEQTIIQYYQKGQEVNLEVDILARYVKRMLEFKDEETQSQLTMEKLSSAGF